MTQFLYLFRGGDGMNGLSPEEMEGHMGRWKSWMGDLAQKGILKDGLPLNTSGKTIASNGTITDGPYAEGKEVVGGYLIINAEDLDSAFEISKGCPLMERENGVIEIREIMSMG